MKKMAIIGLMMICASGTAMAHGYRYDYGYDDIDAMANYEVAEISAQEQADVAHELREGDFREAQQILQRDEAIKYQIRQNEALYDQARDMNRYDYDYGYYGR